MAAGSKGHFQARAPQIRVTPRSGHPRADKAGLASAAKLVQPEDWLPPEGVIELILANALVKEIIDRSTADQDCNDHERQATQKARESGGNRVRQPEYENQKQRGSD